jgi:hypothetical protein
VALTWNERPRRQIAPPGRHPAAAPQSEQTLAAIDQMLITGARIVPFEMVDAALAETRTRQRRVRDLPSRDGPTVIRQAQR